MENSNYHNKRSRSWNTGKNTNRKTRIPVRSGKNQNFTKFSKTFLVPGKEEAIPNVHTPLILLSNRPEDLIEFLDNDPVNVEICFLVAENFPNNLKAINRLSRPSPSLLMCALSLVKWMIKSTALFSTAI